MRLSVIGTINDDLIISRNGERTRSLGGILYNVVALASLMPEVTIIPVAYCGTDCANRLHRLLSGFENVNLSGLVSMRGGCNQNVLQYVSADRREETLKVSVPEIEAEMLDVCLDAELVLVNFISGFELGLGTMERFRAKFPRTIHMDVHSMTLGINDQGVRFERNVTEWREWAGLADTIQMNLREASLFTGLEGSLEQLSTAVCEAGPRICLITLGQAGVFAAERSREGLVMRTVPGVRKQVRETTGCGDVFSAGFIAGLMRGGDVFDSCAAANRAAARCCESFGIEDLSEVLNR